MYLVYSEDKIFTGTVSNEQCYDRTVKNTENARMKIVIH